MGLAAVEVGRAQEESEQPRHNVPLATRKWPGDGFEHAIQLRAVANALASASRVSGNPTQGLNLSYCKYLQASSRLNAVPAIDCHLRSGNAHKTI